jgi:hypothetical protein
MQDSVLETLLVEDYTIKISLVFLDTVRTQLPETDPLS